MKPRRRDLAIGAVLVLLGLLILLHSIDAVRFGTIAGGIWILISVGGILLLLRGWKVRSAFLRFVGALFFVAGVHATLWAFDVFLPDGEEVVAAFFLWLGLASIFMWLPTPHKLDLLIPAVVFGGAGLGYYLWWWDVYRWRDIRDFYEGGWPILLILLGGGILLRSLHKPSGPIPPRPEQ